MRHYCLFLETVALRNSTVSRHPPADQKVDSGASLQQVASTAKTRLMTSTKSPQGNVRRSSPSSDYPSSLQPCYSIGFLKFALLCAYSEKDMNSGIVEV